MKNVNKRIVVYVLSTTMGISVVMPTTILATEIQFTDIPEGSYAIDAIEYGVEQGYINGITDTVFGYGQNIKRQDAAIMVTSALYGGAENVPNGTSSFLDVPSTNYANKYIAVLEEFGIVGDGNGYFNPNDTITRAEFAQMIVQSFELSIVDGLERPDFSDVVDNAWYDNAVTILSTQFGSMGYPDNTWRPNTLLTREAAAQFLYGVHATLHELLTVNKIEILSTTKVQVTFSNVVDDISVDNFAIEGVEIENAILSEDRKSVELDVSKLEYESEYTLVFTGISVDGVEMELSSQVFLVPSVQEMWELEVACKDGELVANGADNTEVAFRLINRQTGEVDSDADNIILGIDTSYGKFATNRITMQDGMATAVLTSEFSTEELQSNILAKIIEAPDNYRELIGTVEGESVITFVTFTMVDTDTIQLIGAESNQADRVILYFDKEVSVDNFIEVNDTGDIMLDEDGNQKFDENVQFEITQAGDVESREIVGIKPVSGNRKAMEVILAKSDILTDNAIVNVKVSLPTEERKIEEISKTFTLTDSRNPEVTSIVSEGMKTLELQFSEPITDANIIIDGTLRQDIDFTLTFGEFNPYTLEDNRNIATIVLNEVDGVQQYFTAGTHSIQITGLKDFASLTDSNNIASSQTLTALVIEDVSLPTASIVVESPEQFHITFDKNIVEDMEVLTTICEDSFEVYDESVEKFISVVDASWLDIEEGFFTVSPVVTPQGISMSEFIIELNKDWTEIYRTNVSTHSYFNDIFRFDFAKNSFTNDDNGKMNSIQVVNVSDKNSPLSYTDNISPVITSINETDKVGEYKVSMSEPVKLVIPEEFPTVAQGQGGLPTPIVEFIGRDKNNKVVTITGEVKGYGKYNGYQGTADSSFVVSTLEGSPTLQELVDEQGYMEDWTVVVKSISDDIGNTAATLTANYRVDASTAITEFEIEEVRGINNEVDNDRIEVTFTEAVQHSGGTSDVTRASNWLLNGNALPLGSVITVEDNDGDSNNGYEKVVISFTEEMDVSTGSTAVLSVNKNLVSLDGTELTGDNEWVFTIEDGVDIE